MDIIEINKRRQLIHNKAARREKLTEEEKKWSAITPVFNERCQEPYYLKDVIELSADCIYQITVTLERPFSGMIPLIGIPLGQGYITANIIDEKTLQSKMGQTKILGVLVSEQKPISSFLLQSKIGYMSVEYQCQYFDPQMNLIKRETSWNLVYGMKKQVLAENMVRYSCKHPLSTEIGAEDFVFVIEWEEKKQ